MPDICGAEEREGSGSLEMNHHCNRPEDHTGEHKCQCGHRWGVRSDGY